MTNYRGDTKFKIIKSEEKFDDDTNKYFIEIADGVDNTITLYRSELYNWFETTRPLLKETEQELLVLMLNLVVSLKVRNYSFGDPYINPICGYPTKLPDKNAIYRMVQDLVYISMHLFINFQLINKIK